MDVDYVVLRLLHFVFGVFWAGSAMFLAGILEPRLRALGPAVQRPVMESLMPILSAVMMTSGAITIGSGVVLALRLWGDLDTFLDFGWGRAILIGFAATLAGYSTGFATSIQGKRLARLGHAIEGRPPAPQEIAELQRRAARLTLLSRTTAVLLLVAVGTMAAARFLQ